MKRSIPLLITAIGGFVLIVSVFIPALQSAGEAVATWFDILASIAFILGGGNLLAVHLRKVSDRHAGWGYSAITLLAFLGTLWVGLLKVGTSPAPQTEAYGETFVPLPVTAWPVVTVPGTIPARGDGKPLPASARMTDPPQLSQTQGQLEFRGWMSAAQKSDLLNYYDTLEWRSRVEELAELARPPEPLRGKVAQYAEHGVLSFRGVMSPQDRQALEQVFGSEPPVRKALDTLEELSRRETSLEVTAPPPELQIPADASDVVRLEGGRLTVRGPMSESLREDLAVTWLHPEHIRPLPPAARQARLAQLEAAGGPLTSAQAKVLQTAFDGIWQPAMLIQALNTAGIAPQERKSARELLAERNAGVRQLVADKPRGEDVRLNAAQEEAVRRFADDLSITPEQLRTELQSAGTFIPAQAKALSAFLTSQPTVAQLDRKIAFDLLRLHRKSLANPAPTTAQLDLLLAGERQQAAWKWQVDALFRKSQQTKFPWSGTYDAPGSPFGWLYTYVFQPVTATMFAMLAFYVASAAFRAFRAKNFEAILLLGTAFVILLMNTFLGAWLTSWIPDSFAAFRADEMKRYIMVIFNTAGNRAIMIGIALGVVATSLKIVLGMDRSYLGSGEE